MDAGGGALFLVLDGTVKVHLARAIAEHLVWCRRQGITAPVELAELLEVFAARGGQDRPKVVDGTGADQALSVTYEGAGARIGVSARTVRRMVADGRLTAVTVGRRKLVAVADLAALVEAKG